MKYRFFILLVFSAALIIMSCGNKAPVSPEADELMLDEEQLSLDKRHHRTPTPWRGFEISGEEIEAGRQWMSEDGILHIRGRIIRDRLETDNVRLTGFLTVQMNYNLNVTTGTGTMSGQWSLDPDEHEGTWKGTSVLKFRNFVLSGHGHGKGAGDFKGLQITVKFHETLPNAEGRYSPMEESGYIIEKP